MDLPFEKKTHGINTKFYYNLHNISTIPPVSQYFVKINIMDHFNNYIDIMYVLMNVKVTLEYCVINTSKYGILSRRY